MPNTPVNTDYSFSNQVSHGDIRMVTHTNLVNGHQLPESLSSPVDPTFKAPASTDYPFSPNISKEGIKKVVFVDINTGLQFIWLNN